MLETAWESRWLPECNKKGKRARGRGCQWPENPKKGFCGGWQDSRRCTLKTPYRRKINEKNQISETSEKQAMKREAEKQGNEKASPEKEKSCNAIQRRTRSSRKGHRADALALRAEERRDKLRKAAGRGTCPVIRRCLNGETRTGRTPCIHA